MRDGCSLDRERPQPVVAEAGGQPAAQRLEQAVGVEHPGSRDEGTAALIGASDHAGPLGGVVQRALHEQLERRVLLFDHQDLGQALGELADLLLVHWHGHQQVEQPDAGRPQRIVAGQAEQAEGLAQLVVGVAAGGDADPVVRSLTVTLFSRLTTP